MGGSERVRFREQNFAKLKKEAVKAGKLWEDPEFPADAASLFFDRNKEIWGGVEWRRPKELTSDPALFVDGVSRDDVRQGLLGNCWFVSACSVLTREQELLAKVIPDQKAQDSFSAKAYAGVFQFAFFRFGRWVEVCVDDRLPCRDGQLLFAHSKTKNEFWCALLEKAFAKLNGCYEALIAGSLTEALMNLSGGVPQRMNLSNAADPAKLFLELKAAADTKALIATAIAAATPEEVEVVLPNGLVKGHSYAVTDVRHVALHSDQLPMLRLQNPWGEKEWNGPWSDGSKEWEQLSDGQKKELGLTFDEDGEFWMTWEDFRANFTDLSVCHLLNTSMWSWSKRWHEATAEGEWLASPKGRGTPADRAGGCPNFPSAVANPQFLVELEAEGELILSLVQKDTERRKAAPAVLTIGLCVMRVEANRAYRLHQLITPPVGTSDYTNSRAEFLHLKELRAGRYVVLPTTYAPGEEGAFLIRAFASEKVQLKALEKDQPSPPLCSCCRAKVTLVTRITVRNGEGLVSKSGSRDVDPYAILECEGAKSRTAWVGKDTSPHWNHSALFYRRKPQRPINIAVYDSNYLADSLLGQAAIEAPITNTDKPLVLNLKDKDGKELPAKLTLSIATYDDPLFI